MIRRTLFYEFQCVTYLWKKNKNKVLIKIRFLCNQTLKETSAVSSHTFISAINVSNFKMTLVGEETIFSTKII